MTSSTKQTNLVSTLAPQDGFPKLPIIGGVRFSAGAAGVKYQGRNDVMLAQIAPNSAVAGVFTKSATRSAPVLDCQAKLAVLQETPLVADSMGLVVNSGNSNAFTGQRGDGSVRSICVQAASVLGTQASHILTSSTGVIGEPLPDTKITDILATLSADLSSSSIEPAAGAIMTTDTFPKGSHQTVTFADKTVQIAGFAKGSGMIAPDMATMLVYIFTDAAITSSALQTIVSTLNNDTFNCITVDSDTSTSDTLITFATGAAGNPLITSSDSADATEFSAGLAVVMKDLAQQVVRDGEGATKLIEVRVTGAHDDQDAFKVGMAIANSPLVKTAFAGEDPNWGRVVMAVGKSGATADRDKLTISFGDILVAEHGWVSPGYSEQQGADYMTGQNLQLTVDMGIGQGSKTIWTCDLTHQYITINADYRS